VDAGFNERAKLGKYFSGQVLKAVAEHFVKGKTTMFWPLSEQSLFTRLRSKPQAKC